MSALLIALFQAVGIGLKNAWSFVKAKALAVWVLFELFSKFFNLLRSFRLLHIAGFSFLFYAIYTVIRTAIDTILVTVHLTQGIAWLISEAGWAGWLVWDGPLQLSVLWDQFVSVVAFRVSLQGVAYLLTKLDWWKAVVVTSVGPTR